MPLETPCHWQSPPPASAPCSTDKTSVVHYSISEDITDLKKSKNRRTPLFQVWVHLHNRPPPIPNISILDRDDVAPHYQTLHDATACFNGVERPINDNGNGDNVVTYVLKPSASVAYEVRFGAPIAARAIPDGFVLTVQVVLKEALQVEGMEILGEVTRIELVECDPANDMMPKNFNERYGSQLW